MIPELKNVNLVDYIGKHTALRKVAAHEWAGACPRCGGKDRLHVNEQKGFFCRQCTGAEHWGDVADYNALALGWTLRDTLRNMGLDRKATPEEIAAMDRARQERRQAAYAAEQEQHAAVHQQLTAAADWKTYHDNLNHYPQAREMWNRRGLSDRWIDYYKLGYSPSRTFSNGDTSFQSPSLTIPYFRPVYTQHPDGGAVVSWRLVQLKHRLLMEDAPGGKYRPHLAGAGNQLFYTDVCEQAPATNILIVEGEIKAMVTWAALWDGEECLFPRLSVIGIPGASWRAELLEPIRQAQRVWIILDPDVTTNARKLAAWVGSAARVVLLPDKIDDLLNAGIIDGCKLLEVMESAL